MVLASLLLHLGHVIIGLKLINIFVSLILSQKDLLICKGVYLYVPMKISLLKYLYYINWNLNIDF